jgi:hypothetical protein
MRVPAGPKQESLLQFLLNFESQFIFGKQIPSKSTIHAEELRSTLNEIISSLTSEFKVHST